MPNTRGAHAAGTASPMAARGIRTARRAGDDFLRRAHFRDGTQGVELGSHDEDVFSGSETTEYEVSDNEHIDDDELGRRDELSLEAAIKASLEDGGSGRGRGRGAGTGVEVKIEVKRERGARVKRETRKGVKREAGAAVGM